MNWTEKQLQEYQKRTGRQYIANEKICKKMNKNKYNARLTIVDRITFQSKHEANYYKELKLLEKAYKITALQRQVKFLLQDGFYDHDGKKVQTICYYADFVFWDLESKKFRVIDTKGVRTRTFINKKKMFELKYGLELEEV
ncbi:MAG: DUF1064 domain-containing protein [Candidatus Heimdallarchaeaceae archaeon]